MPGSKGAMVLPFLPVIKHSQTLRVAAKYLETAAIEGIRYLTTYQSPGDFLSATEIVYTFQGISKDRQHYIAVTVILHSKLLPARNICADIDLRTHETAAWQKVIDTLNSAVPDDFSPSLTLIDSLVQSFKFRQ